jgi:glycosyltransferase-like protein
VDDRPLRIALLTYSTRPRGGVVHALELAEALQALGQLVRLFALEKPGRSAFFRPTTVPTSFIPVDDQPGETMDEKIARYIDAYVAFLDGELARGERYDIYHAEDCISANALVRLRRAGRVPFFVRTVHHIDDFASPGLVSCQHDSIVEPDTVLAVSRWWRDQLADDLGVHARVVHNGVDLDRFVPPPSAAAREETRARLGLAGTVAVLAVGGVEPRKNTLVLLDAFVAARGRLAAMTGRRPVLVLAGGATLFDYAAYRDAFDDRLRRYVADGLLAPDSVERTGPVEDETMLGLYQAADVLAFPSVREGWGLAVLEAQASATPVVASDIEVLREYLVDGENALLVAPGDPGALARALVRAVTDPALAATLRTGGLATARRFGWGPSAERHLEIYRELLA